MRTGYEGHRRHSMGTQEAGIQGGTCWSSGDIDLMCFKPWCTESAMFN